MIQDCSSITDLSTCSSNPNCTVSKGFCSNKNTQKSSSDILNPKTQPNPDIPTKLAPGVRMAQQTTPDYGLVARDTRLAPGVRYVSQPSSS